MIALTLTLARPQEAALELHNRSSGCTRRHATPTLRVNKVGSSADPEQVIILRVVFQDRQGRNEKYKGFCHDAFLGLVFGDQERGEEM